MSGGDFGEIEIETPRDRELEMHLPGFAAESSLYRTSGHYKMAVRGENASGNVAIPQPAAPLLLPGSRPSEAFIGPFPNVLCQPCVLGQSDQCTQYCVLCPGPNPDERCTAITRSCPVNECCPQEQNPCYVPGKTKSCCPRFETCCNPETGFCCAQGHSCCDPVNKICCPPGQACSDGICCPILDDPSFCAPAGRTGSSNYFFNDNCQPILGLIVSFTATEDIASTNGFSVQLNANSPQGIVAAQQYVFTIQGNSITAGIANWQNAATEVVCGDRSIASTTINNGLPSGYSLQITLQYEGNDVSGALFEVLSNGQLLGSLPLAVSDVGCNCNLAPDFQCIGYQSAADLSPITSFQVNIVGPNGGAPTTFTKGQGNIVCTVPNGALTPLSSPPLCIEPGAPVCTGETSNASYGQLNGCPAQSFTQSFNA